MTSQRPPSNDLPTTSERPPNHLPTTPPQPPPHARYGRYSRWGGYGTHCRHGRYGMCGKYDGYGRYGSYMAYMPHVVGMPYVGDPGCEGYMGHIGGTRWRCRRDGPGGNSLFKTGALRALEPTDAPAPAQSSPIQKQSGISATTEASISSNSFRGHMVLSFQRCGALGFCGTLGRNGCFPPEFSTLPRIFLPLPPFCDE